MMKFWIRLKMGEKEEDKKEREEVSIEYEIQEVAYR